MSSWEMRRKNLNGFLFLICRQSCQKNFSGTVYYLSFSVPCISFMLLLNSGSEIKIIIFVDLNIKMLAVFRNVPVVCQIKFHACMRTPPGHWKGILKKAPGPVVLKVFSVVRIVRKGVCPLINHHFLLLLSQSKRQKAPCSNDR